MTGTNDIRMLAALSLWALLAFTSPTWAKLDCRNGHVKVWSKAYHPQDSSNRAVRLACRVNGFVVVRDGIFYSGTEI